MKQGKKILLHKLSLEGFGIYEEETVFHFSEGLNTYLASNESGKTTVFAGVLGVLFGLTHRQNASSLFHLERFRNRNQPKYCRGALLLSVDQRQYQIDRDFDKHQVCVRLQDQILMEGIHNPEGKKAFSLYEDLLLELFGINDKELFEATFFVQQPLPEASQLNSGIQGLLSGGSRYTFEEALKRLQDQLREITKYIGPNHRCVASRNGSKEGELERLSEKIDELEIRIENTKEASDRYVVLQEEVKLLESQVKDLEREIEDRNQYELAWQKWFRLRKEYQQAGRSRDDIGIAYEHAKGFDLEGKRIKEQIEQEYGLTSIDDGKYDGKSDGKVDGDKKSQFLWIGILLAILIGFLGGWLSNQPIIGILTGFVSLGIVIALVLMKVRLNKGKELHAKQGSQPKRIEVEELQQTLDKKDAQLRAILSALQVDSLMQLQSKAKQAEEVSLLLLHEWKEHCEKYPGLPGYESVEDVSLLEGELRKQKAEKELLLQELLALKEKEKALQQSLVSLQGNHPIHIAAAELELQEYREAEEALLVQADALTEAYLELQESIIEYTSSYHQQLAKGASDYFSRISENFDREVRFDDRFTIEVWEQGRSINLQSLSKGARDQLYLAIRFSIADFLAKEWPLPFFFDDSFVHIDRERRNSMKKIFEDMKEERQIFLFSHSELYQGWGSEIQIQKGGSI